MKVISKNRGDGKYAIEIKEQIFGWGLKTVDIDEMFDKLYDEAYGHSQKPKSRTPEE